MMPTWLKRGAAGSLLSSPPAKCTSALVNRSVRCAWRGENLRASFSKRSLRTESDFDNGSDARARLTARFCHSLVHLVGNADSNYEWTGRGAGNEDRSPSLLGESHQ